MRSSALSEVVEAHRALAAQRSKLELLQQQLADKEALLEQARQLVSAGREDLFVFFFLE